MAKESLEEKIRAAAKEAGLSAAHAELVAGHPAVGGLGDGVLLGKFVDFLKLVLPLILPLLEHESA